MSKNIDINTIANRLLTAHDNIKLACEKSLRSPQEIELMAVSKTKPDQLILEAYNSGQRIFGENYAQELSEKSKRLAHYKDIEWHYIGPIQSNKTKIICEASQWVDTIDRTKIATRLNQHCEELDKTLNVLIQVNVSRSENKSGILIEQIEELALHIDKLPHLQLRGLMAIPDKYENEEKTKQEFLIMSTCFSELKQQYPQIDTLSLGMSGDMSLAIESGSTMIRIGTAIFGERVAK